MLSPRDETELAEAVATASGPLAVRGGGTRGMTLPSAGEVLSVSALSGIELYEPGALTIVARAGTPVAEVDRVLAAEGQRLPFEPMDHRGVAGTQGEPTIGGVVAANVSGPRRIQAGACRDSLIGVRFVDGTGTIIKNGGRVMKNVTGYDLVKLMAGSFGTLGVLSEVAFKVLPAPEAAATVVLNDLDPRQAVEALSMALGAPFEVSGAAHITGPEPRTLLRLEGFAASVDYRAGKLSALLEDFGTTSVERDPETVAAQWMAVRDVAALQGKEGALWRVSVRPSQGADVLEALGSPHAVMDWGGGLVWVVAANGRDIRQSLQGIPGHATLVSAPDETRRSVPVFQPEPGPLAAMAEGLRKKYDPRGILNPGLMG